MRMTNRCLCTHEHTGGIRVVAALLEAAAPAVGLLLSGLSGCERGRFQLISMRLFRVCLFLLDDIKQSLSLAEMGAAFLFACVSKLYDAIDPKTGTRAHTKQDKLFACAYALERDCCCSVVDRCANMLLVQYYRKTYSKTRPIPQLKHSILTQSQLTRWPQNYMRPDVIGINWDRHQISHPSCSKPCVQIVTAAIFGGGQKI